MKTERSLVHLFKVITLVMLFSSTSLLSIFWIAREYSNFLQQTNEVRDSVLIARKQQMQTIVNHVIQHVNLIHDQNRKQIRTEIKERVREAHRIASNIYKTHKGKNSDAEIKKMIVEALRPIQFNKKRGYIFIGTYDGKGVLATDKLLFRGDNMLMWTDSDGRHVIKDIIGIAKKNEGYYSYTWTKSRAAGANYTKLNFIKGFKPYGWYIGAGDYLEDHELDQKTEAVNYIESIRYGQGGYVFASTYEGKSLTNPGKGKNMWDTQDVNGKYLVRDMVNLSKNGGGFIEYVMPPMEGYRQELKISYVDGVEHWGGWYVGTGMYLRDIELQVEYEKQNLKEQILRDMLFILFIFLILITIVGYLIKNITLEVSREIDTLTTYFKNAEDKEEYINVDDLKFLEFKEVTKAVNHMVGERAAARKDLDRYTEDLEKTVKKRTKSLEDEKDKVQKLLESRKMLINQLSHDLRTPLTPLIALFPRLEPLMKNPSDKKRYTILERNIRYLSNLITSTLDFANIEQGKINLAYEDINVRELIDELIEHKMYVDKTHKFINDVKKDHEIVGDRLRILELFDNIITNAMKYSPQGETVRIASKKTKGMLEVVVEDKGQGIEKTHIKDVFEEFYRGDEARSGHSVGLGLTICKLIVKAHGGQIWAESEGKDKGTKIFVRLPTKRKK